MVERIEHHKKIFAIIIYADFCEDGIKFFTTNESSQQLGYMNRPAGHIIKPHVHTPIPREITLTQEVLLIKSGSVRIDFYDNFKEYLESRILKKGDIILLSDGGHGFEMLENSEIIEIKQGPYCGEKDKVRFEQIEKNKINIITKLQ